MKEYYLYIDKDDKICISSSMDLQAFYLKKNAVIITSENENSALLKYRQLQTNDFYPLNLNEIE